MNRVFKLTSQRVPRKLSRYERDVLEDIIGELVLPEREPDTPEGILAAARREAEQKVREAFAEGMRKGFQAGKSQFDASVAQAGEALHAASKSIHQARQGFIESLTPQVLELATAIAARVLHREAAIDRDLVLHTVERALEHLANHEHVTVRLNPADLEGVKSQKVELLEKTDGISKLTVVADESITPGGCVASSNLMEADARIESQLEAILNALRDVDGAPREEQA
jgi:flagellar assembly protein FliH